MPVNLSLTLKERARQIGFDLAGVAPLAVWQDLEFSRRWLEQGFAGEMRYLESPKRSDPRLLLPSAKSVICVGLVYNAPLPYSTEASSLTTSASDAAGPGAFDGEPPRGWISRYAWGQDYHEVMREKLEALRSAIHELAPGAETRVYVDTGPIVERAFARFSSIGWMGKNTCLINERKGSWFFLGVILTSLDLEPDLPAPDRCGSCRRCLDACPTGALVEPYVMDASRCIAYFTIELKGLIPAEFRPAIGNNVFGCDICQDVCPWNGSQKPEGGSQNLRVSFQPSVVSDQPKEKGLGRVGVATTLCPEFQPAQFKLARGMIEPRSRAPKSEQCTFSLFNPPLEALASMSEDEFRRAFARSPIKRAKYSGWLRNLCVAMGNSGDRRFAPKLKELAEHANPIVREHARWALERLGILATPEAVKGSSRRAN